MTRPHPHAAAIARLRDASAEELVAWSAETFGESLRIACSLGVEDIVVLDLFARLGARPRVFTLDTGRLHPETYETLELVQAHFDLPIEIYSPDRARLEPWVREHGINGFYGSVEARRGCCAIRKVEPLGRALDGAPAWVTGLRRAQSVTRTGVESVEIEAGGRLKINPLASWSGEDVRAHVRERGLPYHPLHDRGFPSIGCAPCTRAVEAGQPERAGRWWWEDPDHKECGLHQARVRRALRESEERRKRR